MANTSPSPDLAPPPPAIATAPESQHDVIRQARLLRDALQSQKVRLGVFLGAGCPSGVYDEQETRAEPLIPDVARLTVAIRAELVNHDLAHPADDLSKAWDTLAQACMEGGASNPNVEHILTELRTLTARRGTSSVDGLTKSRLEHLDQKICDLIVDAVSKPLPAHRCSYHRFASWVGGLQRQAPVDIFTPNYDLLIEQAFEAQRIPHFDGFVGSREPFFDVASIEQDAIPARWSRLWKLHGSINWQRREDGAVFRAQGRAAAGKAMIYPSHLKYDQSRRMPYLALIDRLRAFFRSSSNPPGLGTPVLVVCGYSFSDDHLNEVLLDGLRGNQSSHCFALSYGSLDQSGPVVALARQQPNLTVLAWDGAVVGTRRGPYSPDIQISGNPGGWIITEQNGAESAKTAARVRCRLGDFHYFALMLEQIYGGNGGQHA